MRFEQAQRNLTQYIEKHSKEIHSPHIAQSAATDTIKQKAAQLREIYDTARRGYLEAEAKSRHLRKLDVRQQRAVTSNTKA